MIFLLKIYIYIVNFGWQWKVSNLCWNKSVKRQGAFRVPFFNKLICASSSLFLAVSNIMLCINASNNVIDLCYLSIKIMSLTLLGKWWINDWLKVVKIQPSKWIFCQRIHKQELRNITWSNWKYSLISLQGITLFESFCLNGDYFLALAIQMKNALKLTAGLMGESMLLLLSKPFRESSQSSSSWWQNGIM